MKGKVKELNIPEAEPKIILKDRPELIAELEQLAASIKNASIDVSSQDVKSTGFYKEIQCTRELDISWLKGVSPKAILLVAELAATSPMLEIVRINNNNLGEYCPKIAKALSKSATIHTINMAFNKIAEYGPETAKALGELAKIDTVIMIANNLSQDAPKTASNLLLSATIRTVDMSCNNLCLTSSDKILINPPDIIASNMMGNVIMCLKLIVWSHQLTNQLTNHVANCLTTVDVFNNHNKYIADLKAFLYVFSADAAIPTPLAELVVEYVGHNVEYYLE